MSQRDGEYETEGVDRLPFSTPEKAQRYQTESYRGAVGLNWYLTDPTLRSTVAYYLQPDELAVVEPHLIRTGELMGGAVARWAEPPPRAPAALRPLGPRRQPDRHAGILHPVQARRPGCPGGIA
ncbi:hypothetical protein YM3MPS_54000 [Mycobacterium pseudoshottsii]|uniref:Uncharacterized protein n=1 Tax=Mycobacterium pseudoshottsii TaxID=265949 RepID=A0A9N7QQT4_9MYCO|nr:hypothetical protein NJB1907Z4_C54350 [Mycobacterium pseudoshottsii]BEH79597.1 hypothetical protein YM3MPS_54000 [Mycobacterium pseudoshottsii]